MLLKKTTTIPILLFISMAFSGCKKVTCEAFDLQHTTMTWHFFPDLQETYQFINKDAQKLIITRTLLDRSELEERGCHMCACFQQLNTVYQADHLAIRLENLSYYDSETDWVGSIDYVVDEINTSMNLEDAEIVEFLYTPEGDRPPEFTISQLGNFSLLDTLFTNILQLEILDSNKTDIQVLWLQPQKGIVGFQIGEEIWKRR